MKMLNILILLKLKFTIKVKLYGLHLTKNEIAKQDSAIIVEGYIDFLQLYQSGIKI